MASTKRDTYGNAIDETEPEWRFLQKRNKDIEEAGEKARQRFKDLNQEVVFFSQGVKCRGTLWTPKKPLPGNPSIVVCHGWGGLRAFLDVRYGIKLCEEGFHVLTFDYRGWGSSDGKLVPVYDTAQADDIQQRARREDLGEMNPVVSSNVKVRVIRQVVDAHDQLEDLEAAVSFLSSRGIGGKIGIFGSSHAGGHVLEYAARDPALVSCVVSQVPSVGRNGAGEMAKRTSEIIQARQRAATKGWIPSGAKEHHLPAMDGSPIYGSLALYDPLLSCSGIKAPTLIIDVENEEIWDVEMNGLGAFKRIPESVKKEYYIIKGAKHYDAYLKSAAEAREAAVRFFKKHLTTGNSHL